MQCSEPCPVPPGMVLLGIFGIIVALLIVVLGLEPIFRYYVCRFFVPWWTTGLERIAAAHTRYEEYWNPDAPARQAASEDVRS